MKTKLVVLNEEVLGFITPEQPDIIQQLRISIHSRFTERSTIYVSYGTIRLATEEDFNKFRVSFDGYKNDPEYEHG